MHTILVFYQQIYFTEYYIIYFCIKENYHKIYSEFFYKMKKLIAQLLVDEIYQWGKHGVRRGTTFIANNI